MGIVSKAPPQQARLQLDDKGPVRGQRYIFVGYGRLAGDCSFRGDCAASVAFTGRWTRVRSQPAGVRFEALDVRPPFAFSRPRFRRFNARYDKGLCTKEPQPSQSDVRTLGERFYRTANRGHGWAPENSVRRRAWRRFPARRVTRIANPVARIPAWQVEPGRQLPQPGATKARNQAPPERELLCES